LEELVSTTGRQATLRIDVPTFGYSSGFALQDIHLHFDESGLAALVGPNGSGKSTLLKIAAGLLHPPTAKIVVSGKPLQRIAPRQAAALVAWVPQRAEALFAMTVTEMVRVGRYRIARPLRPFPEEEEAKIAAALRDVGLDGLADREVETLSGGEWQRTMIARAIVQDTPVLLLDEPIASLDLRYQDEIYSLLRRLASGGKLILVADHHIEVAAAYADRLLLLRDGRIIGDGPPEEILTSERIRETFGVEVQVFPDPRSGAPRLSLSRTGR
jgi:iron complex transport system ATP-binding protein